MLSSQRADDVAEKKPVTSSGAGAWPGRSSALLAVTPFNAPDRHGRRSENIVFAISLAQSVCAFITGMAPASVYRIVSLGCPSSYLRGKIVGRLRRPDGLFSSLLTFPQAATPETFRGGRYPLRFRMPHRRTGGGLHCFTAAIHGRLSRRPASCFFPVHDPGPLVDIYRVRLERAEAIQTPKGHSVNALSGGGHLRRPVGRFPGPLLLLTTAVR